MIWVSIFLFWFTNLYEMALQFMKNGLLLTMTCLLNLKLLFKLELFMCCHVNVTIYKKFTYNILKVKKKGN